MKVAVASLTIGYLYRMNQSYALLDSGNYQKLEQFGAYVLIRPEPSAWWKPSLSLKSWNEKASARFVPGPGQQTGINRGGKWELLHKLPDSWPVVFTLRKKTFKFLIAPTPFGHVGLFPEQIENWTFIADSIAKISNPSPKVLNLFAYTGAASVVARECGADVFHVDASRPVLNWARQNMELNGLQDIHWVYEDALKFVKRETKRGRRYQGIILDPPPAGKGPKGERWSLNSQLDELIGFCAEILEPKNAFLLMSTYAIDWPHENARERVADVIPAKKYNSGDCILKGPDQQHSVPLGSYVRLWR